VTNIDVVDVVQVLQRDVLQRGRSDQTDVVDEAVDLVLVHEFGQDLAGGRTVRKVDLAVVPGEVLRRPAGESDDRVTGGGKLLGGGAADADAGTGNKKGMGRHGRWVP
jgi:hypothetical protein